MDGSEQSSKPRAYSYLRFSTPEQSQGDSLRRQTALAEVYAKANGLELDQTTTFQDLGISAFRGRNAEAGRLSEFLEAVKEGLIPAGSVLLVESLDRISRQTARKAVRTLEDIVDAGVDVVTLSDGKRYNRSSLDGFDFVLAVVLFIRGNEESQTKASRVRAAWGNKRARARDWPLTALGPAWLRLDASSRPPKWEVIEERAEIVRRIFELAASGHGQHAIAQALNRDGVPTFGRSRMWHRTYVRKILSNAAVVGVFSPHTISYDGNSRRHRQPTETTIADYFPRIVTDELFNSITATWIEGRRQPSAKSSRPTHMLAGLARCGRCGATMTRVFKGAKGGKPKLVCTVAKAGAGCVYQGVNVEEVERAITGSISFLAGTAPSGSEEMDAYLNRCEVRLDAVDEMLSNIADSIAAGGDSPTLQARLRDLEAERETTRKELDGILEKIVALSKESIERRLAKVQELVLGGKDVAAVNAMLRQLLHGVVVNRSEGQLRFQWAHGGETNLMFAWPSEKS